MAADVNKQNYKKLKALSSSQKSSVKAFKGNIYNKKQAFNQTSAGQSNASSNYDKMMKNMQKNYDAKLNKLQKGFQDQGKSAAENSDKKIKDLTGQLKSNQENFNQFQERVGGALGMLQQREQQKAEAAQQQARQQEQSAAAEQQAKQQGESSGVGTAPIPGPVASRTPAPVIVKQPEAAETDASGPLITTEREEGQDFSHVKIGSTYTIGTNTVRLTNKFGLRVGDNSVEGREGQHSNGIDITGSAKSGDPYIAPPALADGVVINRSGQVDGSVQHTSAGYNAGYWIDVRLASGKVVRYMHLGPSTMEMFDIGAKIKRGDALVKNNEYSGTGTAGHIKVRIYDVGADGKYSGSKNPANDPTRLLLNGS